MCSSSIAALEACGEALTAPGVSESVSGDSSCRLPAQRGRHLWGALATLLPGDIVLELLTYRNCKHDLSQDHRRGHTGCTGCEL